MRLLDRLFGGSRANDVIERIEPVLMEELWRVKEDRSGINIRDENSGNEYYITRGGGCFCVGGPAREVCDEDMIVSGEFCQYLKGVANETLGRR